MKITRDWVHALMVNEVARREHQPDSTIAIEYTYQHFSRRRYADVVRFTQDCLTVFEAKTEVWDLGEAVRGLRDAGQILPLYEETFKYRTFKSVAVRLVMLATADNAGVVIDNAEMLTGVFTNGPAPGPDGVSYALSFLDPLDCDSEPLETLPIGHLPTRQLAALLGLLTPYEDRQHFERVFWEQRRSREPVEVGSSGSEGKT